MRLFAYPLRVVGRSAAMFTVGAVLLVSLSPNSSGQSLTDRQVFQESFAVAKTAVPEYQSYIFGEVAEAETAHGYYNEAADAAGLVQQYRDQLFIALVTARAKRADIPGAKQLAS